MFSVLGTVIYSVFWKRNILIFFSISGVKNFGDAYLLDTNLWEWTRGPEFLLGADEAGLRVGHTALLARCNSDGGGGEGDATAAATEGEGFEMKAAYFGGQDGDGVRRSELALLTL